MTALFAMMVGATWSLSAQRTEAAASCPEEPRLRRAIAERLGRDPFIDAVPPLPNADPVDELANPFNASKRTQEHQTVWVEFTKDATRYLATVALVDRMGRRTATRELSSTASDCGELSGAVVLAATIVIDPLVLSRPSPVDAGTSEEWTLPALSRPPDPVQPPTVQPAQVAPPIVFTTSPPRTVERRRTAAGAPREQPKPLNALFVGLGAGVSGGQVPELAGLGSVQVSWGTRNTLLSLGANLTSPGSRKAGVGHISALLFSGTLEGCAKWWWLGGCAAVLAGTLQAWPVDLPNPRPQGALWFSAGLGAVLDIPAGSLVRVRLGGHGWYQPQAVLDVGGVPLWGSARLAFTATVSVHVKLWGDVLP